MHRLLLVAPLALACASPTPGELRAEGESTLAACAQRRIDTSVCLSLELIQAEYDLCRARQPRDTCDEVWQAVADLNAPVRTLKLPPLRGLFSERH
jgi:hypothetical protein